MREHLQNSQNKDSFMVQWPSSFESPNKHREVSQTVIPPEILNNLGVLMLQDVASGDVEAQKVFEEALANCDKLLAIDTESAADKRILALRITIKFNLACCHDKANRIGEASEQYK